MGGVKGDNSSVMGNQVGETMHGKGGGGALEEVLLFLNVLYSTAGGNR